MTAENKFSFNTVVHEQEEEPYGLKIIVNEGPFKGFEAVIFHIEDSDSGDDNVVAIDYYLHKTPREFTQNEIDMEGFETTVEEGVNTFLQQLADKMETEGFDPELQDDTTHQ